MVKRSTASARRTVETVAATPVIKSVGKKWKTINNNNMNKVY